MGRTQSPTSAPFHVVGETRCIDDPYKYEEHTDDRTWIVRDMAPGTKCCVDPDYSKMIFPQHAAFDCPCLSFEITIETDYYPDETTWTLTDVCTGNLVASEGPYYDANTKYTTEECLSPESEYWFIIEDEYRDGICCGYGDGSYTLSFGGNEVGTGGEFYSSDEVTFGSCSAISDITPTGEQRCINGVPNKYEEYVGGTWIVRDLAAGTKCCSFDAQNVVSNKILMVSEAETCPLKPLDITIFTYLYPDETTWRVTNVCTGELIVTGGPYSFYDDKLTTFTTQVLLDDDSKYEFVIEDTFGDGMCCFYGAGSYTLSYGGEEIKTGGTFAYSDSVSFGGLPYCDNDE